MFGRKTPGVESFGKSGKSVFERALEYNEQVQKIFARVESQIGEALKGEMISGRPTAEDLLITEPVLESAAEELSQIGDLEITADELKVMLMKKLSSDALEKTDA